MCHIKDHMIFSFFGGVDYSCMMINDNNSVSNHHRAMAINTENDIYKNIKLALKRRHFLTFVSKS